MLIVRARRIEMRKNARWNGHTAMRTVGEIFAEVPKDSDAIAELRKRAREHYGVGG